FFQAEDGIRDDLVTGVQTCALPISAESAGLSRKRFRRVYSASLVDLDRDGDLDLILVSDFCGVDAFENNGKGQFTDATDKWFDETRGFGMAHALTDFNADGNTDFLMIGMNSPTVDRLTSMQAERPYDSDDTGMSQRVTYGNRLYFGRPDGTWKQNPLSAAVARTGWSW